MRVIIEGPKFSGKTTLKKQIAQVVPHSTIVEIKCFFERPKIINHKTQYYEPRQNTTTTLDLFAETFSTLPQKDSIIVDRFHLFDYVQKMTTYNLDNNCIDSYLKIDNKLEKQGFKIILLTPPKAKLKERWGNAGQQEVKIPIEILYLHRKLYNKAKKITKLPIFQLEGEESQIEQIVSWINA